MLFLLHFYEGLEVRGLDHLYMTCLKIHPVIIQHGYAVYYERVNLESLKNSFDYPRFKYYEIQENNFQIR